jgi:integrase
MAKKQSDGRYRAKLTIGTKADGTPIYKYVSGRTQRELEEAKVAARAYYVDGTKRLRDSLLQEYLVQWYKAKKEPFLSDSTREGYRIYYSHIMPVFGDRMMRAILPLEIQEWLNGYAGKSSTTIGKVTSIIQAVYKSACAEGIVSRDPTLGLIKPKPSEPHVKRAFTDEEHERIERTIDAHKHGLFMAILYHLGLRRGEALGLQWGDFNFTERKVTIERDIDYVNDKAGAVGDLKSKAAYRKIPVPDELLSLLKKSRGLPNRYLFSATGVHPMPYSTFQRMWISLMIDAGFARPVESNGKAKKERHSARL